MATVHAIQAIFLVKQMIPYAVWPGFPTVLNKHRFVHDYIYIHQLVFKSMGYKYILNQNCKMLLGTSIHQSFSCQTS